MLILGPLCLAVWAYLLLGHGGYWRSRPELAPAHPAAGPSVDIVVPARDEAATIAPVIVSLLAQDYAGPFRVVLVDDDSTDGTAQRAGSAARLTVLRGRPKPDGWSGKMWAVSQGVAAGQSELVLLTDADIVHDPRHLSALVARLQASPDRGGAPESPDRGSALESPDRGSALDMVSEMVRLNCSSLAERLLVPAFVYFFQMLYPFARVNDPRSPTAAAAGGTVLIRREVLQRIGGIEAIKGALIDDVALAKAVKSRGGALYLGHSTLATSIRPYPRFADIWHMVARTAFTQLRYSAVMLLLTVLALGLVWLAPVWLAVFAHGWARFCGIGACVLAATSYLPTLRRYGRSIAGVLTLPLVALFYIAATVGSALDHWRGAGARWKNRSYGGA
ncbi:MAG TPA: glycosyltransferase [Steroidobacteraceae bacterium]|nr:glycosyltransferase [Steroidobacteraceae bacterium]